VYSQEQFINHKWWEQMAIIDLLNNNTYPEIKLIPARKINSMIINNSYFKGDFICHFAGLQYIDLDRYTLINEYLNYIDYSIQTNIYDKVFLSYFEPLAETNYNLLKKKYHSLKRVNGILGLINALSFVVDIVTTDFFYLIDADNQVLESFEFNYNPYIHKRNTYFWKAKNNVNGLEYGYGGIKLYNTKELRKLIIEIRNNVNEITAKSDFFHFLWLGDYPFTKDFKLIKEVASITVFNTSEFDSWKGGFRECCKLSSFSDLLGLNQSQKEEAKIRLDTWCTIGKDKDYGEWVINGAKDGVEYGKLNKGNILELIKINDFNWLKQYFTKKYNINV
jgi:hypothetical protein